MAAWTLEMARARLQMWLDADEAVATNQSYTIAGRSFTRADAEVILERVRFWRREVGRLERGRGSGARVVRVLPRNT